VIKVATLKSPVALSRYFAEDTASMRWNGNVAQALRIQGEPITQQGLWAAALGHSPYNGQRLYQRASSRRRLGWDLVFAPAKSVSVAALVGPYGDRILRAHSQAVDTAFDLLGQPAAAVRVRTPTGSQLSKPTGMMLYTHVVHRTNREKEPHLHSHLLLINVTQGPDHVWMALQTGPLFKRIPALERVYNHELCRNLRREGIHAARSASDKTVIPALETDAIHRTFAKARARVIRQAASITDHIQRGRLKDQLSPLHPNTLLPLARQIANDRHRPPKEPRIEHKLTRLHWRLLLDQAARDLIDEASRPSRRVRLQASRNAARQSLFLEGTVAQKLAVMIPHASVRRHFALEIMVGCTTELPALPAAKILATALDRSSLIADRTKQHATQPRLNAGLALAGLRFLDTLEPTPKVQVACPALSATFSGRVSPATHLLRQTVALDLALAAHRAPSPRVPQPTLGQTLSRRFNLARTHARRP